ncbi:unnamed protein product, partial [Oppiella nova]
MVRVAVIGVGTLGVKIAGSLAYGGHEVRVQDQNTVTLNKVSLIINEDKRILKEDGLITNTNFLGEVYCFTKLEDAVREAEFIFECVTEDIVAKQNIFKQISMCCSDNAIIATSSMRLSIDQIIENINCKDRCLGVRFLYPVYFVPEVELLPSRTYTSLQTLERVRQFLEKMGRIAFFRSGNEPIVLNEQQREARKSAFVRQLYENKGINHRFAQTVPDLGAINSGKTEPESESSGDQQSIIIRDKECVICMDHQRDCVLHPCHHLCVCIQCGRLLLKR